MPEDGGECESFTVISIDSLRVYESKYYLQKYIENCANKVVNMQMIDHLNSNLFESDYLFDFINKSNKCCITIELIYSMNRSC